MPIPRISNRIRLISTERERLPKNTHRAIIESVDYSKTILVASGNEAHCRQVMDRYLKEHDITELHRAYVAKIEYDYVVNNGKAIHPNNFSQTITERKYR